MVGEGKNLIGGTSSLPLKKLIYLRESTQVVGNLYEKENRSRYNILMLYSFHNATVGSYSGQYNLSLSL